VTAPREPAVRTLEVVTPEGIPIRFEVAALGSRLGAFLLDTALVLLSIWALQVPFVAFGGAHSGWVVALLLIFSFLLRHFYFVFFESRSRGMTPGKRRVGIRVVDAGGGALSAEAVVARNATRMAEVDLPLVALFVPEILFGVSPATLRLVACVWLVLVALLPLFNARRLRLGDLIAGTAVVRAPRALLLPDVGQRAPRAREAEAFAFTPRQLDVYGVYELQVLEDLLRRPPDREVQETLRSVAARVRRKIGWQAEVPPARVSEFLRDFYAAMRAHHERRLLFGRRKRDKHDKS
jgi:uncharacterized RDD family membrane protein YckC